MNAPLSREQQIKLMETADKRHQEFAEKWISAPAVRETLSRPAEGQDASTSYVESKMTVARCA